MTPTALLFIALGTLAGIAATSDESDDEPDSEPWREGLRLDPIERTYNAAAIRQQALWAAELPKYFSFLWGVAAYDLHQLNARKAIAKTLRQSNLALPQLENAWWQLAYLSAFRPKSSLVLNTAELKALAIPDNVLAEWFHDAVNRAYKAGQLEQRFTLLLNAWDELRYTRSMPKNVVGPWLVSPDFPKRGEVNCGPMYKRWRRAQWVQDPKLTVLNMLASQNGLMGEAPPVSIKWDAAGKNINEACWWFRGPWLNPFTSFDGK